MRQVLILGGTGDIGTAIKRQFVNDIVLVAGSKDINLADPDSVSSFIDLHGSEFDVIVHSAGYNHVGLFEETAIADIARSVEINLMGFLPIVQSNIDYWKQTRQGRLVVINSLYGFLSRRGRLPYVISKHGLSAVAKTLAIELASYGVMVNSVTPGYIETKMTSKNNSAEVIEQLTKGIPVGRLGTPDEVADAVAFLARTNNTYITGQNIIVDGGYSVGGFQ